MKQHVKARARRAAAARRVARRPPLPDFSKWGEVDVKPMSNIRRKTAEHLTAAWQAPHVTQHDKADVTALEEFRKTYGAARREGRRQADRHRDRSSRSSPRRIDRFPQFASSVDMANETIVFKKYCHIGVAVDTPNGLLVPVIRDVDRKTITEIAVELAALSQKARDKKLEPRRDVRRRVLDHQPRRHRRHVVHADRQPAGGRDSRHVARRRSSRCGTTASSCRGTMLPLSLSYDHRVIDGADAARFLRFVAEALEQPLTMLL